MSKYNEDEFEQNIKAVLDSAVETTDAQTRYRLQIMRGKVLDNKTNAKPTAWKVLSGVAGIACMVGFAAFLLVKQPAHVIDHSGMLTDIDNVLFEADSSLELYEQYDFYVWLSQQETNS